MECRTTLKNLILVLAVTVSLDPFLHLFFLSFFQQRETRHGWHAREAAGGGQKSSPFHPSLTLSHPHFSINTTMFFMAKGFQDRESNW